MTAWTLAMGSWWDAIAADPGGVAVAALVLTAITALVAMVLRLALRRIRSLRRQVLAVLLGALLVGATVAVAAARLMVLDAGELGTVLGILTLTGLCSIGLVTVTTAPLGRDVRRLEQTVRQVEAGDRTVRTGVSRADELGHVARALDELTVRLDRLERR
jgi:HAMP domain-containing protein